MSTEVEINGKMYIKPKLGRTVYKLVEESTEEPQPLEPSQSSQPSKKEES